MKNRVIIYWSEQDNAFIAEAPELPGCMVDGKTKQEALENLEQIADEWIEVAKEFGREREGNDRKQTDYSIPRYDPFDGRWKVCIGDWTEVGDLVYVACEYVRTSLYYPYSVGTSEYAHAHSFADVIRRLLEEPWTFSTEGHEEYYSDQELELLKKIQAKLQQSGLKDKR